MDKLLISVCADASAASETFVRREASALRSLGWDVREFPISLKKPSPMGTDSPTLQGTDSSVLPQSASCDPMGTDSKTNESVPFRTLETNEYVPFRALWETVKRLPFRQKLAVARRIGMAARLAHAKPRPALLLAQFAWTTADICALASRISGIPWACRVHAWDVFAQPAALIRHRLATSSAILPCTQAAADRLLESDLPHSKIHLVRHGVDIPPAMGTDSAKTMGTDSLFLGTDSAKTVGTDSTKVILAVGRLEAKKGFDTLLRAFALLGTDSRFLPRSPLGTDSSILLVTDSKTRESVPIEMRESVPIWHETMESVPIRLRIIGDGSQRDALVRLARDLGVAGSVSFEGSMPHSAALEAMAGAAVLALPSRRLENGDRDGVANVILEAIAARLPVVTTTAGCAGEIIEDGRNGILVPPDDPQALANAIGRILRDREYSDSLAAAARETIETVLSESETTLRLSAALDAAIRRTN